MRIAARLGFDARRAQELAIVVSELATNQVRHAGGGTIEIHGTAERVEVIASDDGPGIADLALALRDHHSKGQALHPDAPKPGGIGCGLGAVYRLMDHVQVEDVPSGLRIRAHKARAKVGGAR